jgi:hypothetical protein
MAVYGYTVDHGRWWPKGSPESGIAATPVGKTSPRAGEKKDKAMGNLTKGGNWRARQNEAGIGGEWNMTLVLGVGRLGARISRARWGKMLQVKWMSLTTPFIVSGRRGEVALGRRVTGGSGSLMQAVLKSEGGRGVNEALS